jgi:hypothetical protein
VAVAALGALGTNRRDVWRELRDERLCLGRRFPMLWTFVGVLLLLWLLGLLFHVGGGWVYTLVVLAAILVVYNVFINKPNT